MGGVTARSKRLPWCHRQADNGCYRTVPGSPETEFVESGYYGLGLGGRLVKHASYYWLLLAEGHLPRRLFGDML